MAQPHYQDQFRELLGVTAWPGTLNVTVSGEDHANYLALRHVAGLDTLDVKKTMRTAAEGVETSAIEPFRIRGFLREGRSFGGATAFAAIIRKADENGDDGQGKGIPCAILIPDLTRHIDVVEVISKLFLRESLNLIDGEEVILQLG
jgi:CTP-dependent riboflavin kinase